ncbi:MAG: magnesium transporter [Gemmatimonadales bacterium]
MIRQPMSPKAMIALLRDGQVSEFLARARSLEPADLADVLAQADEDERLEIVKLLPPELTGEALIEMPLEEHAEITLAALPPEQAADIVEEMRDADAADILGELEPEQQRRILSAVDAEERRDVERLLRYDEETAGGLMTGQIVTVDQDQTVTEALESIRRQAEAIDDFAEAYAIDGDRRLAGVLSFKRLVLSPPDRRVRELMEEPDITVGPEMDQEEVARLMARYNVPSIPVVDRDGLLLGRITFDDVTDVVEAEATEDLLRFSGVSADEELGGGWRSAVRSRLPWLYVNLITASVAGTVVALFQSNIAKYVTLAAWMPVIAGIGGNTGTQALAVTIRRLALGHISPNDFLSVIRKESLVGVINGAAVGGVATLVALLSHQNPRFGVLVFCAMVGNLFVAGTAGAFIPLTLRRFNIDPAIASSIFVTAFTDISGFLLLLGLAGWVLL